MNQPQSPAVSVVIPAYKGGALLAEAIDSVLKQTFQDFEIIIVDNNADPDTRIVISRYKKEHPEKIRIVMESEQGVCSARNRGILESRGEYIALLDNDDLMKPEKLAKQISAAKENPQASMVICGADFFDGDTGYIEKQNVTGATGRWKDWEMLCRNLLEKIYPEHISETFHLSLPSTMFFTKQNAIATGLYDCRLNPNFGEDFDFCIRMYGLGNFILINDSLVLYRSNSPASLESRRRSDKVRFLYTQGNKLHFIMWEYFSAKSNSIRPIFRKMAAIQLSLAGLHFLRYKNGTLQGRNLLFRAFKYSPTDRELLKTFLKSLLPKYFHGRLFWFGSHRKELLPSDTDQSFAKKLFRIPPIWVDGKP